MLKDGSFFIIVPVVYIATLLAVAVMSRPKSGNWFSALGTGALGAGAVAAVVEFFALASLLTKGTDGPGGLIAIILPMATVAASSVLALALNVVGGLLAAENTLRKQTLSSEAIAILKGDARFFRPVRAMPPGASWRDYARAGALPPAAAARVPKIRPVR